MSKIDENYTLKSKIIYIIRKFARTSNNITIDTVLDDLYIDSITFIKIVVALEKEFNIEFEDNKLIISEFPNVKSIVDYITTTVIN